MSSRARSPSVESVSEISLHPDDDMYGNLDFPAASVLIRSPRASRNSPARSRQQGLGHRPVSVSSHRVNFEDFEVRSEYRASRDRSPLRRPSSMERHGRFGDQEGDHDGRYSQDRYGDVDRQHYRGESGPSRGSGYPARHFNSENHEFDDRQWRQPVYSYESDRFRRDEEWGRDEAFRRNQAWHGDRFQSPDLRYDVDWRREDEERRREEEEQHRRFLADQEATLYLERLRLEQEELSRRAAAEMVRSSASSVSVVQDPTHGADAQLPGQEIPQEPTLQPDVGPDDAFDGEVTPCPSVSAHYYSAIEVDFGRISSFV
ncbi:hypothetical protein DAPPUDRAFT_114667 [Daphnia pulex]|uniref:Uncharacterized protein n=1 Tax=Daphnia pulex TaxID=6669 RepID=E9HIX1_DAPPU|nr:hypothetical protein DAPPUDRAFT_114667 [Daphnia pulex]|eukprot:EFX68285.1 hypothetical protein DAPPUDRAFT_114667 [Daphnia pulex]